LIQPFSGIFQMKNGLIMCSPVITQNTMRNNMAAGKNDPGFIKNSDIFRMNPIIQYR